MFASLTVLVTFALANAAFGAVTGTGDFFPNPPEEMAYVQVGNNGYGTFRVDGGTIFSSSQVSLGGGSSGFGRATVTDEGSIWTMTGASLGQSGVGQLEVRNRGVAVINSTMSIGNSSGRGELSVTGAGSLLQLNSQLILGENGSASLTIADGALVNVPNSQTRIGPAGQLHLDGGSLWTDYIDNRGIISGSGSIELSCCGTNNNYGRIQIDPGDHLQLRSYSSGVSQNVGELLIRGGELEYLSRLQNYTQSQQKGLIELSDGVLRVGVVSPVSSEPLLINRGLIAAVAGENHVYGTVRNEFDGDIVATNNSRLMFHHDVVGTFNSMISVSAGSSATFLQDLTLSGGTLLADLSGVNGFGHVEVIGDFQFSGNLMVTVDENFSPQLGDSFPLAKVTGSIVGTPNIDQLPSLTSGLAWEVQTREHEMVLAVTAAPPVLGDFDSDGDVDGRDFLAWQRDPGVGNLGDWQANYGSPRASANAVVVPEPGCFGLLAIGFVGYAVVRRNR